jgi:hypothetical protein
LVLSDNEKYKKDFLRELFPQGSSYWGRKLITCIQFRGEEWVELYLHYPYAFTACTGATLPVVCLFVCLLPAPLLLSAVIYVQLPSTQNLIEITSEFPTFVMFVVFIYNQYLLHKTCSILIQNLVFLAPVMH